ncbi:septum site-determining protein MinC [Candidatus Methylospira mobilis]|uniref:Probable septum site-determining protein MinC n=1 Tax=Candidatus Methylospira mobilis TaxID=1808979 RepID=A0A5Q0BNR8_9GAMM|nr:septum site-determining protein MinC [Candidatus Methylospira mobilis]QFY43844.1 septum site-determining protein MinC [Candidatus Methylospira mobilis]WNV04838.1 septum site-determining protein MinC [Candidatus Methylospira mobilis]
MTVTKQAESSLFELKSGSINVPVLRLFSKQIQTLQPVLAEKVERAPIFFRNAPLIIDLQELQESLLEHELFELLAILRSLSMTPIGLRGGGAFLQDAVTQAGLTLLADLRHEPAATAVAHRPAAAVKPSAVPARTPSKIIDQPVRSGQHIYASGCDLVVLAPVSAGAEIIADGNIHVYGVLRGRALAGAQGEESSRIFCQDLQAELISVAGHYRVNEQLNENDKGKPVKIQLRDNALIIENL